MVTGAWQCFRMRVICGGQIIEDIDQMNRLHEMFHMMKPSEKRVNDDIEGFGDGETLAKGATPGVMFKKITFKKFIGTLPASLVTKKCSLDLEPCFRKP